MGSSARCGARPWAPPLDPARSVSYTHLDVYKRQALGYGAEVAVLEAMRCLNCKDPDVYKRQ